MLYPALNKKASDFSEALLFDVGSIVCIFSCKTNISIDPKTLGASPKSFDSIKFKMIYSGLGDRQNSLS